MQPAHPAPERVPALRVGGFPPMLTVYHHGDAGQSRSDNGVDAGPVARMDHVGPIGPKQAGHADGIPLAGSAGIGKDPDGHAGRELGPQRAVARRGDHEMIHPGLEVVNQPHHDLLQPSHLE